jgi:drug/metabolite transporter (DMT)-like permease
LIESEKKYKGLWRFICMLEYLFIFLAILFFSISIIIDNFLINKRFNNIMTLLFYSNITNLMFIPLLWIFGLPKMLPMDMILPITIVAVGQILYLYPYFKALKKTDTSIISALFNLGKVFVPILAFMVVHEKLSVLQYTGFAIIIFSSFMLTYEGKLKVNSALIYMILTTLILAISSTVTKYALGEIDWVTVLTWSAVISTLITIIIGLIFYKRQIVGSRKTYLKSLKQFVINEFVTFLAMACITYAVVSTPVTIAQGLMATSPVFMMILIYLGHRIRPAYFKENMGWKHILKKSIFFLIMIIGIILSLK